MVIEQIGTGLGSTVHEAIEPLDKRQAVANKLVGGKEREEVLQEFFRRERESPSLLSLYVVQVAHVVPAFLHGFHVEPREDLRVSRWSHARRD